MSEKLTTNQETSNADILKQAGDAQREALRTKLEKEATPETNKEHLEQNARHEALELASSAEQEQTTEQTETKTSEKPHRNKPTKRELDASFKQTMTHIQKTMKPANRAFSKVIHNPAVDTVSNITANTIARPNLIFAGALSTVILCSIIYFVAKFYSYTLSGTEAIATFVLGWIIGAIIEFARVGFANSRSR